MEPARLFVTGTDTGVGKTVLSLLLMRFFYERGESPFYLKLIQTGCDGPLDTDSDSRFIYENVPQLRGKDPGESTPYCFKNPKAPWFAARDEGGKINLGVLSDRVAEKASSHSVLVMEGAGGLFVPVDRSTLMVDLAAMLDARPILAARAGLGTINHVLLSIEALRVRGMDPAGIVLLDFGDQRTPDEMVSENIEAIEKFSGIKPAGVVWRIEDLSAPPKECYLPLEAIFGVL